jgi:hypothetical protein
MEGDITKLLDRLSRYQIIFISPMLIILRKDKIVLFGKSLKFGVLGSSAGKGT